MSEQKDDNNINLKNARRDGQKKVMEQIEKDDVCPFCPDFLKNYHTEPILEQTKNWTITENAYPYDGTSAHLLFILQRHETHIDDLSQTEWSDLFSIVKKYTQEYNLEGATLLMRFGNTNCTGGTVSHLHAQLVSSAPDSDTPVQTRIA